MKKPVRHCTYLPCTNAIEAVFLLKRVMILDFGKHFGSLHLAYEAILATVYIESYSYTVHGAYKNSLPPKILLTPGS
jgi:hypothetical protein